MDKHNVKGSMIDNRKVHDTHQKGIERVKQRSEDRKDYCGHNGKMGTIKPKDHFARKGDSLTPRKA